MWKPSSGSDVTEPNTKPELIQKIQEEGFDIHNEYEVNGEDRTTARVGFSNSLKMTAKWYSKFDMTPSQTVIEMVFIKEAKRLGTDYFSRKDIPFPDAWDWLSSTVKGGTESWIKANMDDFKKSSSVKITYDDEVHMSVLEETNEKLNEVIGEYPADKKAIYTVGISRLALNNEKIFLDRVVDRASNIIERFDNSVETGKKISWEMCLDLGKKMSDAEDVDELYRGDFEAWMDKIRKVDEKTYEKIMEGYNG